jgi:hypothetical protein
MMTKKHMAVRLPLPTPFSSILLCLFLCVHTLLSTSNLLFSIPQPILHILSLSICKIGAEKYTPAPIPASPSLALCSLCKWFGAGGFSFPFHLSHPFPTLYLSYCSVLTCLKSLVLSTRAVEGERFVRKLCPCYPFGPHSSFSQAPRGGRRRGNNIVDKAVALSSFAEGLEF